MGPQALVGATANHSDGVRALRGKPLSYLGIGPVFGTRSKTEPAPALGLVGLRRLVREADRPVIAIGNITPESVADVLDAGAWGVAVLSDVVCNADPARRVARFVEAIEEAGKETGHERIGTAR